MTAATLRATAEMFLRILGDDPVRTPATEAYYVLNATRYGVTSERISELTHIPVKRIHALLEGGG